MHFSACPHPLQIRRGHALKCMSPHKKGEQTMSKANGRKAIFITGAASGMGLETARLFAEKGWYVGGVDVNKDGLRALEQELGWDNCMVRELDVTDREAYRATLTEFADATDGKLDVMFNNAGIGRGGPFADMPWEDAMAVEIG